jgi:hypothetical protein
MHYKQRKPAGTNVRCFLRQFADFDVFAEPLLADWLSVLRRLPRQAVFHPFNAQASG